MIDVTKLGGAGGTGGTPGASGDNVFASLLGNSNFKMPTDPGTYLWNGWQQDYGVNPQQSWYRNPNWGDHVIWNNQYGYQDYDPVGQLYQGGTDFSQFGLTPQGQGNWSQYYPDRNVSTWWQKEGYSSDPSTSGGNLGGDVVNNPPPGGQQNTPMYNYGAYDSGFPTTTPAVPMPSSWGNAENVLTNFAYGAPTAIPDIWNQGMQDANAMAATGSPTDVSGIYDKWLPVAQQQMKDFSQGEAERLGLSGMRWSTPLQNRVSDYARQMSENFGLEMSQADVQAQEQARARQLQAMPLQYQYGQGISGLTESAKDRGLAGAQGLAGLGQMQTQYPMDLAQLSMNMGLQGQQAQQGVYDKMYNEFLRTSEENGPWFSNAMGLLGLNTNYTPTQYQQSGLSQLLGGLGGVGLGAAGIGSLCNKGN